MQSLELRSISPQPPPPGFHVCPTSSVSDLGPSDQACSWRSCKHWTLLEHMFWSVCPPLSKIHSGNCKCISLNSPQWPVLIEMLGFSEKSPIKEICQFQTHLPGCTFTSCFVHQNTTYMAYQVEKLHVMFCGNKHNRLLLRPDDVFQEVEKDSTFVRITAREKWQLEKKKKQQENEV